MFFPGSLLCFPSARLLLLLLLSASAPHASAWLSVAPSVGLNLHLHSPEFQTAVRWWLGLDTSFASVCPFCPGVALDSLCHHAVSCRHGGDIVIRRNKLRDIIADLCRKAHLSVRVEAIVLLLQRGVRTLRFLPLCKVRSSLFELPSS